MALGPDAAIHFHFPFPSVSLDLHPLLLILRHEEDPLAPASPSPFEQKAEREEGTVAIVQWVSTAATPPPSSFSIPPTAYLASLMSLSVPLS